LSKENVEAAKDALPIAYFATSPPTAPTFTFNITIAILPSPHLLSFS
jgi:hypothetical protein